MMCCTCNIFCCHIGPHSYCDAHRPVGAPIYTGTTWTTTTLSTTPSREEWIRADERRIVEQRANQIIRAKDERIAELLDDQGDYLLDLIDITARVLAVIKPAALHRWFTRPIAALGMSPLEAIQAGRIDDVLAHVRGYTDPSFS